jgi:hypothetical protein
MSNERDDEKDHLNCARVRLGYKDLGKATLKILDEACSFPQHRALTEQEQAEIHFTRELVRRLLRSRSPFSRALIRARSWRFRTARPGPGGKDVPAPSPD